MWDKTFTAIYNATTGISVKSFLICVGAALLLGALIALVVKFRSRHTGGFLATLAMLPATVAVVIMLVNGNLGAGVAVAGAFSLVRFRSLPGTAREIGAIFIAMAVGLGCGMGYPGFSALFAGTMCLVFMVYTLMGLGQRSKHRLVKVLRITVPENLDYANMFDDLFTEYTSRWELLSVKTTNLGSLNRLTYEVVLKKPGTEKALIDGLRVRNGNLEISLSIMAETGTEL